LSFPIKYNRPYVVICCKDLTTAFGVIHTLTDKWRNTDTDVQGNSHPHVLWWPRFRIARATLMRSIPSLLSSKIDGVWFMNLPMKELKTPTRYKPSMDSKTHIYFECDDEDTSRDVRSLLTVKWGPQTFHESHGILRWWPKFNIARNTLNKVLGEDLVNNNIKSIMYMNLPKPVEPIPEIKDDVAAEIQIKQEVSYTFLDFGYKKKINPNQKFFFLQVIYID
jgi:hypothetical protein